MKKKILIVTLFIPYPLSHGGYIAQYYFLDHFSTEYDLTLLTEARSTKDLHNLEELKRRLPDIKLVVQNNIQVKAEPTAVSHFIDRLKKYIRQKLAGSDKANVKAEKSQLSKVTFETAKPKFARFILDHLKEHTYAFIQLEFFNTLNLLPLLPPAGKKIFVHHELYYKRLSKTKEIDTDLQRYLVDSAMQYEHALLRLADVVVVFNQEDKALLSGVNPNVIVSPFGIPTPLIIKSEASSEYEKFVFLGGEGHYPNKEGLIWFLDTIYIPNYASMEWPVYILGVWSDQVKSKYSTYDKIIFTGFVEQLDQVFDGAVMITPILSGSGIRTKILQAFANKVPVLSTPFAAEGLYTDESDDHILFFTDEKSFLKIFKTVALDQNTLQQTAGSGYTYFTEHFNEQKLLEMRKRAYT